jgi:meso-butanediol dehydrogenase / (S,S)-butanediol dehydrogenase / diacetyl reductase
MVAQHRFDGKVALVTGAGSGIGRAVTLQLAAEGAQVFAHDLNGDTLGETAKLAADAGGTVATRTGNITGRDECFAAVAAAVDTYGKLDVLGNIAGIARAEHFTDVPEAAYRQMMGVNMDACFFFAQAAIPHLIASEGNVVNIASNAGLMGQAYTVAYCMTKGAIVQFTKALALEYVKDPIRVNAIAPGGTDTTLSQNFQVPEDVDFELMARYTGFRPMGSPDDIAALFALVASDEGRSFHGAILSCDNGITAG